MIKKYNSKKYPEKLSRLMIHFDYNTHEISTSVRTFYGKEIDTSEEEWDEDYAFELYFEKSGNQIEPIEDVTINGGLSDNNTLIVNGEDLLQPEYFPMNNACIIFYKNDKDKSKAIRIAKIHISEALKEEITNAQEKLKKNKKRLHILGL